VDPQKTAFLAAAPGAGDDLRAWLEEAGFAVRMFDGGPALLEAAHVMQPSVVILDVDLPSNCGGLETTRALKQDPLTQPIPIIVLAGGGEDAGAECFDAGADDFIFKPVSRSELCTRARAAARAFETYQRRHEQHAELAEMYFRLADTEEQARLSEARVHAIIEAAQDAVFTLNADGCPDLMNGAAEVMFGLPRAEAAAVRFVDLFAGDTSVALGDAVARVASGEARSERQEAVARGRAGDEFPVDCSITCADRPEGLIVCVVVRDLRSARRIEALLRQTQHLAAVGRIAAGIAHEINTPIQCIGDTLFFLDQGFAEMRPLLDAYRELVAATGADGVMAELITRVRHAEQAADIEYVLGAAPDALRRATEMSKRIADIVKATKDFARPEQRGASHEEFGALVRNVLELTRASYAEVADLDVEIEEVTAVAHASELGEAVRHMISNAADAVRATGRRGRIWVRVERAADGAQVTVADDGCGIPSDVAPHIFDPFFTTKQVGSGVGLGLFMASAAAHRHEGSLTFEGRPGGGSTFTLRIPHDYRAEPAKLPTGQGTATADAP
jgi:PAS domain S-box-containing protein